MLSSENHDALFSVKREDINVRMVDPAAIPREEFETFDYDRKDVFGLDIERVHSNMPMDLTLAEGN